MRYPHAAGQKGRWGIGNTIADLLVFQQPGLTGASIVEGRVRSLPRRIKMLAVSIAFVIGIAAAWFIRDSLLYERTNDAEIDGRVLPLSARINGYVEQVNVSEGQMVSVGDVLAMLGQRANKIAVEKALANLAYAENIAASLYLDAALTVSSANGGPISAQAEVRNAQGEVLAAG